MGHFRCRGNACGMQHYYTRIERRDKRRGLGLVRFDELISVGKMAVMKKAVIQDELVFEVQRLYPQIYLACHLDHVRAGSTRWNLSSHDASVLAHLDVSRGVSPRALGSHLGVVPSTLSATIARLRRLGYISSPADPADKRKRQIFLTARGAEAMAGTSVLEGGRVRQMLERLSPSERGPALEGLRLLARAAREISEEGK